MAMQQRLSHALRLDARSLGGFIVLIASLILGLVVGITQAGASPAPLAQGDALARSRVFSATSSPMPHASASEDDCPLALSAEPPPAPTNLSCIPISETEIALCWRDNSCNESEFRVERSDDGGPWHEVASLPRNTSSYRDGGLTPGSTYRYRVRGYRESDGQYSAYTNETACVAGLAGRVRPSDRTCENPPAFQWTPVSGAITYTLQVATTPTFDPPLSQQAEITGTAYTPADLLPLPTYYWRVRGRSECAESAWSATWSVTLIVAPGPPEPVSPPDGYTTCDPRPTFCWTEVPGATSYSLLIDDDADLRSPVVNLTGLTATCVTLTESLPPGRYYWSADAANECGRAWSPPRVLMIESPPGAPELVSPPDGEDTCEATPTFSWTPPVGADSCCFQLDDDPDFSSPIVTECLATPPYTITTSLTPGTYYWRVKCRNLCGFGDWSSSRRVVVISQPGAPTLEQPTDGFQTCDNTPDFSWSSVQGATCYSFKLANTPDFSTPLISESCLPTTTYTVSTPLAPGTYYWRADASNECGRSWSQYRSIVILEPPPAPELTAPPDAGKVCTPQPTFSWTPPVGADSCCFQLDDDPDFSSPIVTECQVTPPYTITVSLAPGTYYWRVRCYNECGGGGWSQVRSFSVSQPPQAPTLQQPEDGLQTCDTTPTFSWSPVQGATRYSFQLADNPNFSTPLIHETSLLTTTFTITTPLAPGTYYWRADASNECGTNWSSGRRLVILQVLTTPPAQVSPPDQASTCDDPPSFCWTLVPGATAYDVEIDGRVYAGQQGPCFLPAQPLGLGGHTWRVRAINACGPGPWSPLRRVTIQDYEMTCQNLVCNSGFETDECWIDPPACAPRYSTYKAHSGSRSILIGVPTWAPDTRCTSAIWQPVTIPADAASATLSFWYWPWSQDTIAYDWQEVQVRDASFNVLEVLMRVNETSSGDAPWRQRTFDLTRYAGRTIYIYFAVRNDGVGNKRTFMYVDDVSLVVCRVRLCPAPSTAIAGRVFLQGRTDHGGVQVRVDGTPCDVTDAQGRFRCSVTPGTHLVSVSRCKYLTAQQAVNVPSGITFNLPDVSLRGGDVNNDCAVDIFDVVLLGAAYDTCPGNDTCASTDANGDGCVDIRDLVIVGGNYGLECPRPWFEAVSTGKAASAQAAPVKVQLTRSVGEGGRTRFQVLLEGASRLYAADMRLRFDPTLARVVDSDRDLDGVQVQPGPWLRDEGTFVARANADNAAGVVHLAFARLAPASPLHGDVLLATVDLLGAGELTLASLELLDPEGRVLEWAAPEGDRLPFRLYLPQVAKPGG